MTQSPQPAAARFQSVSIHPEKRGSEVYAAALRRAVMEEMSAEDWLNSKHQGRWHETAAATRVPVSSTGVAFAAQAT